jgi:hypothetical protein
MDSNSISSNLSVDNFNKPSNKKWKLVGDILVYALIPELGIILSLPISPVIKLWISVTIAELSLVSKLITKFTLDNDQH